MPCCSRAGPIEPFDDGSNKPLQIALLYPYRPLARGLRSFVGFEKNLGVGIVTGSANSVYQKHGYMNITQRPKINLAIKAL